MSLRGVVLTLDGTALYYVGGYGRGQGGCARVWEWVCVWVPDTL